MKAKPSEAFANMGRTALPAHEEVSFPSPEDTSESVQSPETDKHSHMCLYNVNSSSLLHATKFIFKFSSKVYIF